MIFKKKVKVYAIPCVNDRKTIAKARMMNKIMSIPWAEPSMGSSDTIKYIALQKYITGKESSDKQ